MTKAITQSKWPAPRKMFINGNSYGERDREIQNREDCSGAACLFLNLVLLQGLRVVLTDEKPGVMATRE